MKDHDAAPSAPTEIDANNGDAKPPNYESIQRGSGQQSPHVHFSDDNKQTMQAPMMAWNGVWYPQYNTFQYSYQAMNPTFMSNEWIEEQKENTKRTLEMRGIPSSVWEYYIEVPKDWDVADVDTKGVHNGVRNILMSQRSVKPWWIQDSSLEKMVELKKSFMKVIQALEEVDRFIKEDMPDDSQLNAEYNRAEKRASKLHEKL